MAFSNRSLISKNYSSAGGQKTMSVYGGAGGYGTRISTSYMGSGMSYAGGLMSAEGLDLHVDANEKAMMQNLNHRLESYLEKVRKLEKENEQLEIKIREWYNSRTVTTSDYTRYFVIIKDLQDKLHLAAVENAKVMLQIDNAKLASEDFKMKFENELQMRMVVETDIAGLKKLIDELNLTKLNLESQYESMTEELIMLKKNHEEELAALRTQVSGNVNVKMEVPSALDLNQVLSELREYYENMVTKNRKELELWYNSKLEELKTEFKGTEGIIETSNTQLKDLKSTLQTLKIELQSQLSMKAGLEESLEDIRRRFAMMIAGYQAKIDDLSKEKSRIDAKINQNDMDYCVLLDIKTRLEAEIAEYRRLLDGQLDSSSSKQVVTKVITVQETYVDGKKVESNQSQDTAVKQIK